MTTVTATGTNSPITITGLTAGSWKFEVAATNAAGTGAFSSLSPTETITAPASTGNPFTARNLYNGASTAKVSGNASRYGATAPADYMYVNEGGALTPGYPYPGQTLAVRALTVLDEIPQFYTFGNYYGSSDASLLQGYFQGSVNAGQLGLMLTYWIPNLDGGSGGASSQAAYESWIDGLVAAKAAVSSTYPLIALIEPDALPMNSQFSGSQLTTRQNCLNYACKQFASVGCSVYLDAGNSKWSGNGDSGPSGDTLANFVASGIQYCRGYSTNVSNFEYTSDEITFGNQVAAMLTAGGYGANAHQIIDTSRNGLGPWNGSPSPQYNPPGRAMGQLPSAVVPGGSAVQDAGLFIKTCGFSDSAGLRSPTGTSSVPDYVVDMSTRTTWFPSFTTMPSTT